MQIYNELENHRVNCLVSCKDRTPTEYQSSVVYTFSCPGCQDSYNGEKVRCLHTRIKEDATNPTIRLKSSTISHPVNTPNTSKLY